MKIKVNGKYLEINRNKIKLSELLKENNIEISDIAAIQLNGQFVIKEEFETTIVKDNDEIDFLYFMKGG